MLSWLMSAADVEGCRPLIQLTCSLIPTRYSRRIVSTGIADCKGRGDGKFHRTPEIRRAPDPTVLRIVIPRVTDVRIQKQVGLSA